VEEVIDGLFQRVVEVAGCPAHSATVRSLSCFIGGFQEKVLPAAAEKAQNDRDSERIGAAGGRCLRVASEEISTYNLPTKHQVSTRSPQQSVSLLIHIVRVVQ
jgi:hypothetical protein